jgi:hypothetical protein
MESNPRLFSFGSGVVVFGKDSIGVLLGSCDINSVNFS